MDDFNKTPNIYPNLNAIPSNEQQFRLNKINEIKDYFLAEIRESELISKKIIKCFIYTIRQYFYCIVCNCYWSTCRNNWGELRFYVFKYIRICKKVFKNNKK